VTVNEWISSYAAHLGAQAPTASEIEDILAIAAAAAHSSERLAAPIACWIAGQSGRSLAELRQIAEELS
jgi:uncharacterized protein DUF6457